MEINLKSCAETAMKLFNVWLTRENRSGPCPVTVHMKQPVPYRDRDFNDRKKSTFKYESYNVKIQHHAKEFKKHFGFLPPKGCCIFRPLSLTPKPEKKPVVFDVEKSQKRKRDKKNTRKKPKK